MDVKSAKLTFAALGFAVNIQRNLRYSEMLKLLNTVANEDHSERDAFVLVVLSHGSEGTIFAFDSVFPTQKLWEPFTADRAPTLAGKPKLFFIQV